MAISSLFHVGVLPRHRSLGLPDGLVPTSRGPGVMRFILDHLVRFGTIQVSHIWTIAEAALGSLVIAGFWRLSRYLMVTVEVPGSDQASEPVLDWIAENALRRQDVQQYVATAATEHDDVERCPIVRKPIFQSTWFFFQGRLFMVRRIEPPKYEDGDDISTSITCLGLSPEPAQGFLKMCLDDFAKKNEAYVRIYSWKSYYWRFKSKQATRSLKTVHLDQEVKTDLLRDIEKYMSPATQKRYQVRGMPYRRGYLFHGPPGTGKSTLSGVLAGAYGLDLYEISIPGVQDDEDLRDMFNDMPDRGILLLEDIDAAGIDRESYSCGVTLSGLLNALDGVGSQQGRIVIMTTNKPEALDEALTRPGRIDKRIYVGHISQECAEEMFMRMFEPEISGSSEVLEKIGSGTAKQIKDTPSQFACSCSTCLELRLSKLEKLASEFASHIPEKTITPAQLQGFFQIHMDCPQAARDGVQEWVETQQEGKDVDKTHAEEQPDTPAPREDLNLKVTGNGDDVHFKISSTTKLKKLMEVYCESQGKKVEDLRFIYDGQRIEPSDTSNSAGIEDGDVIEIHPAQIEIEDDSDDEEGKLTPDSSEND